MPLSNYVSRRMLSCRRYFAAVFKYFASVLIIRDPFQYLNRPNIRCLAGKGERAVVDVRPPRNDAAGSDTGWIDSG
jgi:hypothetical protein